MDYLHWLTEIAKATGTSIVDSYADVGAWSPLHWASVLILGALLATHRRAAAGYAALVVYVWALRLAAVDLDIHELNASGDAWIRFGVVLLLGVVGAIALYYALFVLSMEHRGWKASSDGRFRDVGERGLTRRSRA